ncbi:mannosyltransferase family protein, partial [Catenuloplanes japonicus]|uniref:mannosyltransferase family protein n=1 Tax=Catenuloplanes japonicus TaxID=33876 RepID=UPI000527128F
RCSWAPCNYCAWACSASTSHESSPPSRAGPRTWSPSTRKRRSQWDALHYVRIAEAGYPVGGPGYPAFFPLYPLLIRLTDPILPGGTLTSASVVANVAAIGALALLHRLTAHETDPETAHRAVWYLTASPMGFFLFIGYNESLF